MGSRCADVSTRDTATPLAACTRPCLVPLGLVLAVGGWVTQHSSQQQVESLLVRQAQGRPRAFTGPNPLACSAVATPRPLVGARNYPHVTAHSQLPHATSHTWSSTTAPDAMQEASTRSTRKEGSRCTERTQRRALCRPPPFSRSSHSDVGLVRLWLCGVQWARGAARCGAARCPPCSRCRRPPLYSAFARPAVVLAYAKHARP